MTFNGAASGCGYFTSVTVVALESGGCFFEDGESTLAKRHWHDLRLKLDVARLLLVVCLPFLL